MQCKAKAKSTGKRCKRPAMRGMAVCRFHGGMSLKGAAAPNFKDGRYSKYMPAQLESKYAEALKDPNLVSMRDEIAVITARLQEMFGGINTTSGLDYYHKLVNLWGEYTTYGEMGDTDNMARVQGEIGKMILKGESMAQKWEEIIKLIEMRRKLAESEQKRLINMNQMISVERASMFVFKILGIIKKYITDPKTLSSIAYDFRVIMQGEYAINSKATYAREDEEVSEEILQGEVI